jgi:hypothetical protein
LVCVICEEFFLFWVGGGGGEVQLDLCFFVK